MLIEEDTRCCLNHKAQYFVLNKSDKIARTPFFLLALCTMALPFKYVMLKPGKLASILVGMMLLVFKTSNSKLTGQ